MKERWQARLQALRLWIETHGGNLPEGVDALPCGFGIARWLQWQREQLRSQRLDRVRIGVLDDAAPGWRTSISLGPDSLQKRLDASALERENRFTESLRGAAALLAELGRLPRVNDMGTEQVRVAMWLSDQRRNKSLGILSGERVRQLDHSVPGWRDAEYTDERERQWQTALASLAARVKEFGRLPTGNGPNARWMHAQRKALQRGWLCEGRKSALNEVVPGWNEVSSTRESEHRAHECESTGLPTVSKEAGI